VTYSLRIGSIKQKKDLMRPERQIWCNSALPWSMDISDVSQSPRQRDSARRCWLYKALFRTTEATLYFVVLIRI
jgi:hypothetical protein